jgi:hypothetical protein
VFLDRPKRSINSAGNAEASFRFFDNGLYRIEIRYLVPAWGFEHQMPAIVIGAPADVVEIAMVERPAKRLLADCSIYHSVKGETAKAIESDSKALAFDLEKAAAASDLEGRMSPGFWQVGPWPNTLGVHPCLVLPDQLAFSPLEAFEIPHPPRLGDVRAKITAP